MDRPTYEQELQASQATLNAAIAQASTTFNQAAGDPMKGPTAAAVTAFTNSAKAANDAHVARVAAIDAQWRTANNIAG